MLRPILLSLLVASSAHAQLTPEWFRTFDVPQAINSGPAGMLLEPGGHLYLTGRAGNIWGNLDALVWKVNPDGSTAWPLLWDSPTHVHDQGHAVALSPTDNSVILVGATIGQNQYAGALIIKLDRATGAEIWHRVYDTTFYGEDVFDGVAVDAQGNIYAVGKQLSDGLDGLIVKYSPSGDVLWDRTWDGQPEAPYSLDYFRRVLITESGDPIVLGYGITGLHDLNEDWVITRYSAATGDVVWREFYGGPGRDIPAGMVMDAAGDIYITGEDHESGITNRRAATVKYSGATGSQLWAVLDQGGSRSTGNALTLTPAGSVAIAVVADPDSNVSNFNENFYIVSRDQQSGAFQWEFRYGANCVSCFDSPQSIVATTGGHLFVAGPTNSSPYSNDIILFRLDAASGTELNRGTLDPGVGNTAGVLGLALDAAENLYLTGQWSAPNLNFYAARYSTGAPAACYANCDNSTTVPALNVADFTCFLNRFAAGESYANCDNSTTQPTLNVADFTCFLQQFAAGCP
jgi:hypothetical protein